MLRRRLAETVHALRLAEARTLLGRRVRTCLPGEPPPEGPTLHWVGVLVHARGEKGWVDYGPGRGRREVRLLQVVEARSDDSESAEARGTSSPH
ncbi:MAG: hypothetical protein AAF533_08605 [Acidobacteriota bacterium]